MGAISSLRLFSCAIVFVAVAILSAQSSPAQEPRPAGQSATPLKREPQLAYPQARSSTQQSSLTISPQEAQPGSVTPRQPQVQEQLIAEISAGSEYVLGNVLGGHILWSEKSGNQYTVRLDGKQVGETYQQVHVGFRGEPENPHVIMVAKRGGKWVALYDGKEETAEYYTMTAADVGPGGHPFIVGACREKKCYLVMDGKETGPQFQDIGTPDFNLRSGHYAYFGRRDKRWVAMLDGKETGPEMDDYYRVRWGPEGKFLAVAARLGNRFTWVVDGVPGPLFDVIGEIAFSPDGRHYAFGGARAKSGFGSQEVRGSIVVDGKENEQAWKGEGLTGGWTALFGSYRYVLKGVKRLSADFHGVSDPTFTADGSVVFAKRLGVGNVVVYFGGRAGPVFDDVVSPIITSDDGKHVAYVGRRGDSFVDVRDQVAGTSFPGKREMSFVGWIAMSKDGTRVAYEIVRGGNEFKQGKTQRAQRRIVLDGKGGREYDAHELMPGLFSEKGTHSLYTVHGAQGDRDRIVFDEVEAPLYDDLYSQSARFVGEESIEFVARQGRRFLHLTMTLGTNQTQ